MKNTNRTPIDDTLNGALIAIAVAITLLMNLPWFQDKLDAPGGSPTVTMAQATPTTTAPASHLPATTNSATTVSTHVPHFALR